MRVMGGTMRRVMVALVFTLVTAGACGSSGESRGSARLGPGGTEGTTSTQVEGPAVQGVQVTPSVPPVTPSLSVPPATASVPGVGGSRGPWPRRGYGCRRAPYPKCSQTSRRPCCRPGDPANARFNAQRPAGA
jgi:hypothetical protein